MTTPTWLAATPGQPAQAGQVNQLLVSHQATVIYTGVETSSQQTGGGPGAEASYNKWLAQKFTAAAGQTTTGYVVLFLKVQAGSPPPWAFSIQADNGSGAPSGKALVTTQIPKEAVPGAGGNTWILLPTTGLTPAGVYWIVAEMTGDASDYYTWDTSNQTSGASTSTDGITWTAQTYGFIYQVWDGTVTGGLTGIYEDNGDRWTVFTYTNGQLTFIAEWTVGQTPTGYAWSTRTLSYSATGLLTGVA